METHFLTRIEVFFQLAESVYHVLHFFPPLLPIHAREAIFKLLVLRTVAIDIVLYSGTFFFIVRTFLVHRGDCLEIIVVLSTEQQLHLAIICRFDRSNRVSIVFILLIRIFMKRSDQVTVSNKISNLLIQIFNNHVVSVFVQTPWLLDCFLLLHTSSSLALFHPGLYLRCLIFLLLNRQSISKGYTSIDTLFISFFLRWVFVWVKTHHFIYLQLLFRIVKGFVELLFLICGLLFSATFEYCAVSRCSAVCSALRALLLQLSLLLFYIRRL